MPLTGGRWRTGPFTYSASDFCLTRGSSPSGVSPWSNSWKSLQFPDWSGLIASCVPFASVPSPTSCPTDSARGAASMTRNFGPGRSASTVMGRVQCCVACRTWRTRWRCSSAVPCEKLIRTTSTPASIRVCNLLGYPSPARSTFESWTPTELSTSTMTTESWLAPAWPVG